MSKLDTFHMTVVSNYIKDNHNFINLMAVCKKNKKLNKWFKLVYPPFNDPKLFKCEYQKPTNKVNFVALYEDGSYEVNKLVFKDSNIKGLYLNTLNNCFDNGNGYFYEFKHDYYSHTIVVNSEDEADMLKKQLKYIQIPYVNNDSMLYRKNQIHLLLIISIDINPNEYNKVDMIKFDMPLSNYNITNGYRRSDQQEYLKTSDLIYCSLIDILINTNMKELIIDDDFMKPRPNNKIMYYAGYNNNLEYVKFEYTYHNEIDACFCNCPNLKYVDFGFNRKLGSHNFRSCHPDLTIKFNIGGIRSVFIQRGINYIFEDRHKYIKIGEDITKRKYYYIVVNNNELYMTTLYNIDYLNGDVLDFTQYYIPDSNVTIDNIRFKRMKQLTKLYIPRNIKFNNTKVFKNCHNLKRVIALGNEDSSDMIFDLGGCYELEEFPFKYCNGQDTKLI